MPSSWQITCRKLGKFCGVGQSIRTVSPCLLHDDDGDDSVLLFNKVRNKKGSINNASKAVEQASCCKIRVRKLAVGFHVPVTFMLHEATNGTLCEHRRKTNTSH